MPRPSPVWRPADACASFPTGALRRLLTFEGSLTQELTRLADGRFHLELLAQSVVQVHPDVPGLTHDLDGVWVPATQREVLMYGGGVAVVAALTLMPARTLARHAWLRHLGRRSLGHALLAQPEVERRGFTFARLPLDEGWLGRVGAAMAVTGTAGAAAESGGADDRGSACWARRSVFRVSGDPLLVTEAFLPGVQRLLASGGDG